MRQSLGLDAAVTDDGPADAEGDAEVRRRVGADHVIARRGGVRRLTFCRPLLLQMRASRRPLSAHLDMNQTDRSVP